MLNSSCKSKKVMTESAEEPMTSEMLTKEVKVNEFKAESMEAKARMQVGMDGQSHTFRGHIRSIQDSAIWVRATVLGFEVGRVMITPDTFQMLDRINGEYVKLTLEEVGRRYGMDISFNHLQQVLLGSPSFEDVTIRSLEIKNPSAIVHGFFENIMVQFFINDQRLVEQFNLEDPDGRVLKSYNKEYREVGDSGYFAFKREINGNDGSSEFFLNAEFLELEVNNSPTLPFSVPSRYDRIE